MDRVRFFLIFCSRNDNYSDQNIRIPDFIDYYSQLKSEIFTIELVLVDWNTDLERFSPLAEAFDWESIKTHHIQVTAKEHEAIDANKKRKILDYAGRNRGLDFSSELDPTGFSVIVNQDIFIKKSVFEKIASLEKKFDGSFFYRADRTDVKWGSDGYDSSLIDVQIIRSFERIFEYPMNYFSKSGTNVLRFLEKSYNGIIEQRFQANHFFYSCISIFLRVFLFGRKSRRFFYSNIFCVHGNASGDFLVMPNAVLQNKIIRYPETAEFYMHTDSYILFRLLQNGSKQRILIGNDLVYHVDHERNHNKEDFSYEYHLEEFGRIIDGKS